MTDLLSEDWQTRANRYKSIILEIGFCKDLPGLLKEVDEAIDFIQVSIDEAVATGGKHTGLDALKNEFWFLKLEIQKRLDP